MRINPSDDSSTPRAASRQGPTQTLRRDLNLASAVALVVGTMIGSGIFVSPGGVLQATGSVGMSFTIWFACGLVALGGSLCYIELGHITSEAGGEFAYLLEAFGPLHSFLGPIPAFLYQWASSVLLKPSSCAIILLTFSNYLLSPFFDECGPPRFIAVLLAVMAILTLTALNCWRAKVGAYTQNIFTLVKLLACTAIVLGGGVQICKGNSQHLSAGFKNTISNPSTLALAFYNGLWAYDGWNNLNYSVEELKDPHRNLPRAIMVAIPLVTAVYIFMNLAYLTALSPAVIVSSPAVAVSWAKVVVPSAAMLIPFAVSFSTFGAANGSLFGAGRITFAAARRGHAPQLISMLHRRSRTPMPALILQGLLSALFCLVSNISTLIDFFSFIAWLFYGLTFLSLIVMRWTKPLVPRPFKVSLPIPIAMLLLATFLMIAPIIDNPRIELVYAAFFTLSGLVFYVPFVYMKLQVKLFDQVTTFMQLGLNVVPPKACNLV